MEQLEKSEKFLRVTFQWMVGDLRALEKNLLDIVRIPYFQTITVIARFVAFGLVFLTSYLLLENVDLTKVFVITLVGSLSIWVSWLIGKISLITLEKLAAKNPKLVGWNDLRIDRTGILWDDETSQEYMSWQGIYEVIVREGSIWFKTGPTHGYFIPARLFSSDKSREDCLNLISYFRENSTLPIHKEYPSEEKILH